MFPEVRSFMKCLLPKSVAIRAKFVYNDTAILNIFQVWLKKREILNISQKRGKRMYQKERMDEIYDILKKNGYVTVKYLVQQLGYSNATVNRDLNVMENQKRIRRSYGGVELSEAKSVPLIFRYHKMKSIKNKMGKAAADLIADGDTVFIDGSTTTE